MVRENINKRRFSRINMRLLRELGLSLSKTAGDNLLAIEFGESVKVTEVLKEISRIEYNKPPVKSLTDFYIAYYEKEIKKENVNSSHIIENNTAQNNGVENDIVEEKTTVESLKDELIGLLNQRNALDMKISEKEKRVDELLEIIGSDEEDVFEEESEVE